VESVSILINNKFVTKNYLSIKTTIGSWRKILQNVSKPTSEIKDLPRKADGKTFAEIFRRTF
jgi:hypothetical protein